MQVPSRTELERWFDADRADEVHFVETVASWPSLRVLDHLFANGTATTGEISRALNMDMREVKDLLDALESHGTVEETDEGWTPTTDRISITLTRNSGLELGHTTESEEKREDDQGENHPDESADDSPIAGLRRFLSSLFS